MTRTTDPFDELTALFLTDPAAPGGVSAPRNRRRCGIDLLLVGHLPVRAGLWLGPFADAVARDCGAAALLRLDLDEPTIEIYRGDDESMPELRGAHLPEAINVLGPHIGRWIVRTPPDAAFDELVSVQADRIVILSGADEAALVAAYRIVKDLADAAGNTGEDNTGGLPPIGLAVMGASRQAALQMVERLNRTASTFLGFEMELIAAVPQMDASMRATRYERFAADDAAALADVVSQIRDGAAQPSPMPVSKPRPPARAAAPLPEPPRRAAAEPIPTPSAANGSASPPAPSPPRVTSPAVKLKPGPSASAQAPASSPAPLAPDSDRPACLAEHVDGLTPLPIRCPARGRIELAVDSAGGVHLLGWEQSMRDFWFVSEWVRTHLSLIMMACPEVWFDAQRRPACHLFTDRPASLADMHGSDLRLHVLAPVKLGDQTAWYSAPLNG